MSKLKNLTINLILCLFVIFIIIYSKDVSFCILNSFDIWLKIVFPSLFPFFIISDLFINYGFIKIITPLFSPIMRIFGVNKNASFILIMSMISGFPSGAKYTKELLLKKMITQKEADRILTFAHFSNPLFIIGTVSVLLNSKKIAFLILFIHFLSSFIVGIIFRNNSCSSSKPSNINMEMKPFGEILKLSIVNTINTLLLILGTITFFMVISLLLSKIIVLPSTIQNILNGFLEMTQGIYYVGNSCFSLQLKASLIGMFLSFGGLSVHIQVLSIISDTKIKYQYFLLARIISSIISFILIFILFNLIN